MTYHYYQVEGGDETWQIMPAAMLDTIKHASFVTILGIDVPVAEDYTKEQYAAIKYKGPLYFDLDDSESPASTSIYLVELIDKLEEKGVSVDALSIYASGGKGFHLLVPENYYLAKPPQKGIAYLPAIYKEMAFDLAVRHMDMRVYTARRGRMFRQENVKRTNGRYKVRITYDELKQIAELSRRDKAQAEERYNQLCSEPRHLKIAQEIPSLSPAMLALFDQCKAKVTTLANKVKKQKPPKLADNLPSFEALLRGEGLRSDSGFHPIALQVAITAHAKGMSKDALLAAAEGLCQNHQSDGNRYNTADKRRAELARMWDYTEDNPCYAYSSQAITSLLNHQAPDLRGLNVTEEEVQEGIEAAAVMGDEYLDQDGEFEHAGIVLTNSGAFVSTETGQRKVTAMAFGDVTELVSSSTNTVSELQVELKVNGEKRGSKVLELDAFNSVASLNKVLMPYGQAFNGTDQHARGLYMRLVEKARKRKNRMHVVSREGLDIVSMPFHEEEDARSKFMVWSDLKSVTPEPKIQNLDIKMKFVGFPTEAGQYQTDLSQAPSLKTWIEDPTNKKRLHDTLKSLLHCQKPSYLGKLVGWTVACHYRMMFHEVYNKFPLLHINGAAGAGKTEMTKLMANFHYFHQEPKMLTPTSTLFAVGYAASGSASIPLILDEFKPSEMAPQVYDKFKLMLRDAYNCRNMERGGGTKDNSDYRAVHTTQLSAPICFIAEAAESESALMERVVLLTLVKPPVIEAQKYLRNFLEASSNREVLGIIGSYMAAMIVKKYSLAELEKEFNGIYDRARQTLMLQEGEEASLSPEDLKRKSGAKERTVFNYSVARFGLRKLTNLIEAIFPGEFTEVLGQMDEDIFTTVADLQQQTIPEWLKVFNSFADMAAIDPLTPHYLRYKTDYAFSEYGGKQVLEIYARSCYHKYRQYCMASRITPLFPSEAAFVYSLQNLPSMIAKGMSLSIACPGGSHLFDLDELRAAGFVEPMRR